MLTLDLSADQLVASLLRLTDSQAVSILDSCGVGHQNSHLLIAGCEAIDLFEISDEDPGSVLNVLDRVAASGLAAVFTLSYSLGEKLIGIEPEGSTHEPDAFIALYNAIVVHNYISGITSVRGDPVKSARMAGDLLDARGTDHSFTADENTEITSNFSKAEYTAAIGEILERIRQGDTYQTNLTQQLTASLPAGLTPQIVFRTLRTDHPAPFGAFISRPGSTVVSISPERFLRIDGSDSEHRTILTSPIKGTRPRGSSPDIDRRLRDELLNSEKDRAENTMIVDLLRNDLGRVCKYGSVKVDRLCDIEAHPTIFHLVSSVIGELKDDAKFSEVLRSLFPCGSITGAPKISTMRIINEIESADRGLSMGAIGCSIPRGFSMIPRIDMSVAIRTLVFRDGQAVFNVGGGIVIDSEPELEYEESMLKAKALISALK